MKAPFIIMANVAFDATTGILQRQRHAGADALGVQ
jgi:hypothetical protein